nr:polyprotein [Bovine kobuvirus]
MDSSNLKLFSISHRTAKRWSWKRLRVETHERIRYAYVDPAVDAYFKRDRRLPFSLPKPSHFYDCLFCNHPSDEDEDSLLTLDGEYGDPCPLHSGVLDPAPRYSKSPEDILEDSCWCDVLDEDATFSTDSLQNAFDNLALALLPGPRQVRDPTLISKLYSKLFSLSNFPGVPTTPLSLPKPTGNIITQGTSQTNIYGNGNNVTTDLGANGWSPTVNTGLGDGPVSSSQDEVPGRAGGSSSAPKNSNPSPSSSASVSHFKHWWEPAASKALSRGVDKALDGIEGAGKLASDAIKSKLTGTRPGPSPNLIALNPSSTQHGNAMITTGSTAPVVVAYPPTPSVPLPNPDCPSEPGPSGDRTWLLDTFEWTQESPMWWCLAGQNGMQYSALSNPTYPFSAQANWGTQNGTAATAYPLPASFVQAYPDCPWTAMHDTHAYYNCGWRMQVVVNGTQFHAGALLIYAVPERPVLPNGAEYENTTFVYPYTILNLYQSNTATLEVPYVGCTPNTTTCVHSPWTFFIAVLTPLAVASSTNQSLSVSVYITPVNSSFYGLRHVTKQHWKTRAVPGSGAFGTAVAGQEIPIYAFETFTPPVDYLPAEVHDWLEYAHRPGWADQFSWTTADTQDDRLALVPISPAWLSASGTPISFVLDLFTQWRGELTLSLLFTGSSQHYGRLVVCYSPPSSAAPSSITEAMRGTYTVWDINSSSTLDFTIPFISQTYWKITNMSTPDSLLASLGTLTIWVVAPLVAPSAAPPSAIIHAFLSASNSFSVRGMSMPTLALQAGEGIEAPTPISNLENGEATHVPEPRTTFAYTDNPSTPETNLRRYFSVYRPVFMQGNQYGITAAAGVHSVTYNPVEWIANAQAGDTLPLLLSAFTYFRGDPRVAFTISNPAAYTAQVTFHYFPPGATPYDASAPNASTDLANCFTVDAQIPPTSMDTVCLSFPYLSVLSAIPTSYFGFSTFQGGSDVLNTTLGTIVIYVGWQGDVPPDTALTIFQKIAFGNFRGFVPRNPPKLTAYSQPTTTTRTNAIVKLPVYRPMASAKAMVRRQCAGESLFQPCLCSRVYIVRAQRMTYTHWALRCVDSDGTRQISLSRFKLSAVVAYEEPEGGIYQEVEPFHWSLAVAMVGSPWDYSASHNCTHFVSNITGVDLPNTGFSLALGIGALAIVAGVMAVQTAKGRITRQGLLTLEAPPEAIDAAHRVSRSIEETASAIRSADLLNSTANLTLAASDIREASTRVSSSIDGFSDMLRDFAQSFRGRVDDVISSGISSFLTWLTKIFGYLLILFGSPTPMSIAGLLVVICADLAPQASHYFTERNTALGALFYWLATKLGLSVTPEEAEAAAIEPQGVRDFNDGVQAVRNTEWLAETAWKWAKRVLDWIRGKVKTDPQATLADSHDEILRHYSESIAALGSERTPISAIIDAISRCRELVKVAADAKSAPHSSFLNQALRNYQLALTQNRMADAGPRAEPVVIYLYGPPGTGKSLLGSLLASVLAQKLSGDPNDVYSPTSASCEYFDGYTGQVVHFIDDLGQDPEGRDWANFPNLVSSAPFIVPMANLEAKGTHYTSKVIVVTSNFTGPNQRAARSMGALERRLHLRICVDRKDGYKFDAEDALRPLDLPSKYLTSQTKLSLFKCFNLKPDLNSIFLPDFHDFDQLVDAIIARLDRSSGVSARLASLIKRQGAHSERTFETAPSEIDADEVLEILSKSKPVPTHLTLERAIASNAPLSFIDTLWKWRKPLFATTTFLTVLGFVITVLGVAKVLWTKKEDTPQEPQAAYAGMPQLGKKDAKAKGPKPAPTRGVVRQAGPSPALPKIADNVLPIQAKTPAGVNKCSALYLYNRICIVPTHIVPDNTIQIQLGNDVYDWATLKHVRLGKEMTVIWTPTSRQYRDLRRFLGSHPYPTGHLISAFQGVPMYIRFSKNHMVTLDVESVVHEPVAYGYKTPSFEGMCGAPLITDDPAGIKILGFHVAGIVGSTGFSVPFYPYLPEIEQFATECQSLIIPGPEIHPGVNVNRKSQLGHSPAYGAFPVKKQPAVLHQRDARLEPGTKLDDQLFLKHNKGDMDKPWPGLEAAAALYFSKFPTFIRTLTQEEAINGTPNMDGMDMNQAAGYPWNTMGKSRRSLFIEEAPGYYVPTSELQAEIDRTLEDPNYFYSTFLKDELRPTAKVTAGLTRVVEAAPVHAIVAGRMLLGGLIEYMQAYPGRHGSAVGCNPDLHWSKFFFKFAKFDQVYDLDYKCFDATLPSCAFRIVEDHLVKLTGDERVRTYIETIRHSKHVYGSQTYEMIGGNPSGCVGTSIINTIINNICVLSALIQHPDFSPDNYRILAYGDDVIYGCDPPIHPRYIKEFYDKHTPLVVTPANKGSDFPDSSTLYDVTFLKRWFVPDDQRPFYIHPVMDPDTYEQSVMWLRGGDFQDLVTSLCYLAFHSGPKTYQRWCERVREQCLKTSGFAPTFLPYEYLQLRWLNLCAA